VTQVCRMVRIVSSAVGTASEWGSPLGESLGWLIDMETELLRSKPLVMLCHHGCTHYSPFWRSL
jgi:hypothetical protein